MLRLPSAPEHGVLLSRERPGSWAKGRTTAISSSPSPSTRPTASCATPHRRRHRLDPRSPRDLPRPEGVRRFFEEWAKPWTAGHCCFAWRVLLKGCPRHGTPTGQVGTITAGEAACRTRRGRTRRTSPGFVAQAGGCGSMARFWGLGEGSMERRSRCGL
jgi:hypothetical protein